MPNKVTYTITTSDGKEHQVSKENVDKYGIQSYADAYKGATIRMRDAQKGDYDIPLQHFDNARKQGLHAFSLEHMPVQKQMAPKPTPTSTAKPTPSPSVHPRQSTPQGSKPLLSDSFGKGTGTDFLKPKPVGYNLSEEHRNEVLGEQARRSTTPSNPHVQHAVQLGNEAKTKRVEREQKRFGKPTIAKAFDDAVHGDKKAAKELGMPQVMQQKKDEIDYMQATGKELRNPVDAGLTYDENGDVVHSMFAPTVARDEHGNIVTNEAGEPLVGISSDEARAKAYGDSVQTGIEAQREKDKVDNLYKDAVESVNDAFDEDYKKKEDFRKEHPFLGAVSDALERFSNRGNALQYTPEGAKPGLAALGMLSKAAIAKNNADRYGDAGTLSRLYGGIMAGLTDVDTYDFGITDTFNAANLYRAAKNYEEGKATAKDKMLLDAAAIANNVQSEASDKLGGAFGAGQNLVGTIGFMAQMATNPASGVGKEAAASVAKTIAKRALQKFGKGAIAKAVTGLAKGATRVGMDAVEAGVVTGMYSPIKIVGDYLNRKTGDVQSDGKGGYIFQNKEYSDVKALAKAINGQYAENISEMWGEYLPGVGKVNAAIGRGMRKVGLGKVVDAFEHMSSSNWAKTWKNFQEKTKWNGMAGEYFEEVANNLYNAVTNGDMTLDTDPHTGVFNPKINLDTFYSVALMSGIMSGVNTAGYARERYKAPHEQRKADAQARSVFGERWDEYKNAIDNADEKQIGSVMEKIGSDKSLSNSQKIAALQYQYRTAVVHGVNAQDTKNKLEGQFNAMDEAYSMGYNLQDEKELNNTAILYDEAKKQATKATGWGVDTLESMIGEDGGASTLAYMKHSDEFNDEQLQAFTDYANARAAYNGMIQRVKDDIDTKVHESNLEVEQRTNLDTGAIHPATMKVDDRQVYIVNGNVVMLPDGSGVDHEHSDDFVVLRDAETGELETADPSAIFKVDAPINVQEEKEAAADNIRQTFAQQQADKIDGKLEFKQGDTYSIIDKEDGAQHSLSIIGDAIDEKTGQVNPEMVLVDIDGAQQPILLPKEQVQQQVDEVRRAAVAATQVVENAPTTNTNNTYNINDEVTLSDENGNTILGSITAPENEDGKFEVYTEQPINGKKVNLFSAEELDSMTKVPADVAENATTQQPQQQEETENSVEKETPQQQTTALERIPTDESGQPLYEQTDPETAWDAIVEQTEGDTSMAQAVADDMVSDLEAGVKKAEKTRTKSGGSIAEKIVAEKERAAVIEQAKEILAHWRKIAAVNRMREAAIQAEEQRKADEMARVRKEEEEKARAEQEEAERIKRETLNGVPDFIEDKAPDARARGYRRVNGDKVDRQEPIDATIGKEVQVKFDDDNIPTGHVAIIEANQLQPSHKNGQRNPQHFIDEAQPKERKDDASVGAARKIAANIRPEEITSSVTAYTGAPTVNSRGEVIQGNNRSAALREMWDNHQEQGDKYKQYLIDHAESFGLRAEDIAAMDKPVLVNMLDVNDDEAISLGQFVASDTESGGTERIKPKNVVKKLGDKMKNFANILLRANDENISFAELIDSNGVDALKWLNANGVISPTQYKSAFDSKGNITAEAKNDIKSVMYQSIFAGGNTQLEEMFNALPAKAQKAILATVYRDYDSPQSERMIEDIQDSIMAYYALSHDSIFMNAKNHKDARIAVEAWRRQLAFDDVTGESYLPAEKYSNFALLLATMYKGDNQSLIQGTFNKMYDLIQGTQEETLFEQPDNTPRSLAQAIKETLNIEHNEQQGSDVLAGDSSASQEGRTGSNGDATSRGRSENSDGTEANQGGTEGDTERSGSGQSSGGSQEEVAAENSHLTKKEAADFIAQMELGADVAQEIPLTIENWDKEFGEDGIVSTPIGDVKMGENQFAKLMRAGRNGKLGMLKPTLEYPDAIVEENSKAKEGTHTERPSSFIFIKSFRKSDGTRYYYFTSITVSVDGKEVVVSNQEKSRNRILRLLMEGSVIWRTPKDATTSSAEKQGLDYVHPEKAEGETKGSVITPQNTPSVGKDKQSSATKQEKMENFVPSPKNSEEIEEEIKYAQEALDELKEYQKRTDTTGRTSVDENGFDSEDLYIPLLLDGKSSRLGVLMSIPDRITNPSGQVATYDYSNDEGNADWQKWDDLAEEYNKDVGSEERAYTNGDEPILRFKRVDAAVRFADWLNSKSTIEHNNNSSDEDLFAMAERVAEEDKAKRTRKKEEAKVDTNPTEAQKEAGNYKKGHIKLDGFNVTIEQPKGSVRRGKDANGKEWKTEMHNTYGYIRGTESVDGDHIDIFLSDNPTEGNVFVVDQVNKDGSFDEHKIMYGFSDMESARKAYLSNYEEGWQGLGNITEVSKEEFKKWIDSSKRKTKPFAEYKSVRPEMGVGFDTEHAQSSDNYAQNSEKVRKAIDAYEDAQEKFDNLFSLLVKEKESKPFDTREWREVNRTKEELKDVLLQLNTKELGELLKQVSGKDTENVIKNVLDIVNREEHRLIAFNAILDKQSYITPEYKEGEKAIPVSEFVETDKKRAEIYTILTGVFHDKGYVVGTDAYLLLARKEDYDKSLEGKVTNKKGEVINGKYPNWRAVVNSGKQGKSWGVNLEELHAFTRGVLTKLKTEKANPSIKKDAKIAFKTADGKIVLCYANALDKALQGAKSIDAKSFFDNDDVFAITQTPKGYVICPMLNQDQNIDDNSFAYVPRVSELQHSTETLSNDTEAKRLATDTILSALNKAGIEVVRATDEQVQELFANTHATSLRTPQGTIYGWVVDGKIYLTEAGINPDTPIHEYTHLWAEAMKTKNKKDWNSIKALLKETPVWNEVVADPNYSNIMNNADAVASEVLSRISGRENAARMVAEAQKVIDEDKDVFEKAKSVTLLNRIKRALDMFWKWVGKELFKIKKFGSINEVTDRVLYDLMHSTKLNSNGKSLIGVHNISEQNLRKVLEQGGFANPSIAVIDTDKQVHNDYGEISLILPSRKINKSTGKNAGTFEGDAWTPMYPVVEKQISSDGRITIHNDINAVPKDMQSEVRNALNRWLENGSDTDLSYLYLFQQGKAPQMIVEKPKYSNEVHKTLNDIMFGVNSVYNLSKNEIKKLVELYIQTELDGNIKEYNEAIQRKISKYEELIKRGKPNSLQYRVADSYLEDIEKYGYPLSPLINFVNDVQRDKIKQGSKNAQKTLNTASQIIKDAGLEKDFKNWVEGLNNRYQTKEVIFDGFTPTGKRRYIPNTLENVSKIMKKQGRQASAGISISFSNFAAAVMKANGSLDNIRKKKSKLTNEHKDIEDFEEKWKEVYFDLAMKLQPNANMFDDYGFARLQEAANEKNPQTYIRNVYGITLSEEDVQKLQDLVEAIREERPALYFETKFERPVILNEFSKAVVPEDLSDDLKKTLRDNGVEVFTYKRGDVEERQKATQEAAYSSNDIAFQVIDNSRDGNNTDRLTDGLNAVNEQFNRELAGLTEENADTKIFNLGSPSSILLSAGVEDKSMKLYGSKLMKKAKLHGFAPKELENLPAAVADPIAVFDNYKKTDNRSILTELKTKDGNFLVSLTIGKGIDVDFNIIASAFGKANDSIVKWINKGFATYINKEKALNYLYLSAPIAEAAENSELSSAAKIVKDFVNPVIKDENLLRDGAGNLSDDELSMNHDPVAKMLGKSNRTEEDHKAFAKRERQRMISRISELADRLHLDNVEVVTDSNSLQGKKAKAKGFYSKSSGKITIVIPNHASVEDVEKTLLHEAVAHYGLRKLFGEHFETFLDNVYQNVEPEIRRIITSQAANNNWDFRTATEEYLAGLAERTDFERVHYAIWNKIKSLFLKMLHSIGFEGWSATELSDNELRYLLWRSYENMKEPGRYRSILGEAEDVAKQNELKVGNYDQQKTNSSNVAERGILYREDDSKEKERVNAREKYEQRINRAMFQTQEALQDSMLGLKEAMNAITKAEGKNVNIEDIDGYENAYLGENRLSSVNKAEADAFAHLLFKPMLAEVSKLCKNAQERAELVDYMMAKHGLERNAIMRKRAIEDILNNEKLSDAQKSARAGLAEYRDYAGLTALTGKDNVTEAEVDAETMVSEYESTHDTTNLWDKINAVNAAILSKSYECGMMDKDTYEKISDMYKYYIPLRGFDETTSEEAYAYLLHQSSAFNAPIKVAKGRSSKADDPFANMQSMAESAITQGNRNKLVKQRFFNFVLNHPSDLVSISDIWLKYDDVADEWKPVFPDNFEENDSAEDIEQKLKEFEDKMKTLAEQAPDKYKHGKETANIPYRVVDSRDLRQHQVLVKRGGRDYILTLNGNPRAAQALNGQTNPDNDTSGAIGAIFKAGEMVNRQLSAFYTTRNPDFVVSNFIRDMLFSNSIVWVKESPNYALRFHRNIARCNPAQIKVLLAKHRKGTLDMNNKLEHMFYQFMMNGGETGYANVRDIEQHKNDIRRELKRANGKLSITKAFNLLGEKLDEYNRAVENCARFAAYLTSREMGRTVERSIYDAKEISVNFNKKGSGAKFMNAVGQTKIGTASAFVSGIGRSGFVFWNAAIQGTTNFGRQFKKHPAKAFTASAIMFLLGAVIAGIGMGDGDDDADANSYWNLPEYVRRSNILFKMGDQWVSIPLPVEYRAIYGMGELMVSAMSGKEHFTGSELGKAIAGQATQVLPIDFLEGGGGVKAFVPSAVKPFAEIYSNKGWTGMPIYKDTPYNKYMPEWTKAYKSANKYLVGIAQTLNEATGGDAYTKGSVDINPAQIEYLLNGYFGGVSGTIDKLSKSAETIAGDREYDPRNFLLLNRILKNGDERTEARAINNEYMRVKEEHDVLKARMKHYENDTDKGLFDYADKIDFLYNSPEFARYEIFEDYSKDIDALYQELKEANDGAEHLSIEKELTELKKEMIEEMNKTRK